MGLYRALGRPLFFALPPEFAHRLARSMLGWPLPWERVGAVPNDPRLHVTLAGLELLNPVGLAAGFDKELTCLDALGRLGFGYVVGGTITRAPRAGNPKPRIVRRRDRRSLVNSMGLPNPGAETAVSNLRGLRRTVPRLVSVADEAVEDAVAVREAFAGLADGFELNASCPNVGWGRDRDNEAHLGELVRELKARGPEPLFVKLPPFQTQTEREVVLALARVAQEHGADALTCSNTRPIEESRLAVGRGGLSGGELTPGTPGIVREVRAATGGSLPINACGGVFTTDDALACIEAGATTVQIYTSLIYEGPRVVASIAAGVLAALDDRRTELAALVGSA